MLKSKDFSKIRKIFDNILKKFRFTNIKSIQKELIIVTSLTILIVGLSTTLISINTFYKHSNDGFERDLLVGQLDIHNRVEVLKTDIKNESLRLSSGTDISRYLQEKRYDSLEWFLEELENEALDNVIVYSKEGEVVDQIKDTDTNIPVDIVNSIINNNKEEGYIIDNDNLIMYTGFPITYNAYYSVGGLISTYNLADDKFLQEIKEIYKLDATLYIDGNMINSTFNSDDLEDELTELSISQEEYQKIIIEIENGKIYHSKVNQQKNGCIYYPIIDEGEVLGLIRLSKDKSDFYNAIYAVVFIIIIFNLVLFLLGFISIYFYTSKRIKKPLKESNDILVDMSSGDYRAQTYSFKYRNEFGSHLKMLSDTRDTMRRIIERILDSTEIVANNSTSINDEIKVLLKTVEIINTTMESLEGGAFEQAKVTEKVNLKVSDILDMLSSINVQINESDNAVKDAEEYIVSGKKCVELQEENMVMSKETSNKLEEGILDLKEKSNEIEDIINVIKEISETTKLLSLNATIEAARAGKSGKGFAVVADEIRRLSNQTNESIEKINQIITAVQVGVEYSVENITEYKGVLVEQEKALKKTVEEFDMINESTSILKDKVDQVSTHTKSITMKINNAGKDVREIATLAEETASITQEVKENMQEQKNNLSNISNNVNKLEEQTNSLKDSTNNFIT